MQQADSNLIWIDLEMTGLEPATDTIIEIATIVTDRDLREVVEGPNLAVHQSDAALAAMDDWNTQHHGDSGLTERVRASEVTTVMAEAATLKFLETWIGPGISPMCGNSVGQDRRFLDKYMPKLAEYFHYRNIDVSTLKELSNRWSPKLTPFAKRGAHLALDDIRESIAELCYYREHFLRLDD